MSKRNGSIRPYAWWGASFYRRQRWSQGNSEGTWPACGAGHRAQLQRPQRMCFFALGLGIRRLGRIGNKHHFVFGCCLASWLNGSDPAVNQRGIGCCHLGDVVKKQIQLVWFTRVGSWKRMGQRGKQPAHEQQLFGGKVIPEENHCLRLSGRRLSLGFKDVVRQLHRQVEQRSRSTLGSHKAQRIGG